MPLGNCAFITKKKGEGQRKKKTHQIEESVDLFPALKSCENNSPQKLVNDLRAQSKDSVMSQTGLCQNKKVITKHVAIGPVLPVSGCYPLQPDSVKLKDTQTV